MSPSPGTSRCDDATVPTLKSLTCTSRIRSMPARTVSASARSAQHALSSMHTPVSSRRARSIASRNVCTKPTSTRNEFVCSIAKSIPRGARLDEHGRERCFQRVGGLFPREGRERTRREHDRSAHRPRRAVSMERTRRSRCVFQRLGSARWNGPSPIRSTTCSPRSTASATSRVPASQPNASSLATDTPTLVMPCRGPEREIVGQRELERRDRARRTSGRASVSRACGHGRCCCPRRAAG